ncbi:MAG: hypothetical protein ACRCYO_10050 [Bacteroidia bacterium]
MNTHLLDLATGSYTLGVFAVIALLSVSAITLVVFVVRWLRRKSEK